MLLDRPARLLSGLVVGFCLLAQPAQADEEARDACGPLLRIGGVRAISRERFEPMLDELLMGAARAAGREASLELARTWSENLDRFLKGNAHMTLMTPREAESVLKREDVDIVVRSSGWTLIAVARKASGIDSLDRRPLGRIAVAERSLSGELSRRWLDRRAVSGESVVSISSVDDRILAVLQGEADVAIVPRVALTWLSADARSLLREIGAIGDSPGLALVVGPCVRPEEAEGMAEWLTAGSPHPAVRRFNEAMGIEGFFRVDKKTYLEQTRMALEGHGSPIQSPASGRD